MDGWSPDREARYQDNLAQAKVIAARWMEEGLSTPMLMAATIITVTGISSLATSLQRALDGVAAWHKDVEGNIRNIFDAVGEPRGEA